MQRIWLVMAVMVAMSAVGCRGKGGENSKGMVLTPEQQLRAIRAEYQRSDPNARVGQVIAVRADTHLAAVGDIPVKDFQVGEAISFLNRSNVFLTGGTIIDIVDSGESQWLVVRYDASKQGPGVGDLGVWLTIRPAK